MNNKPQVSKCCGAKNHITTKGNLHEVYEANVCSKCGKPFVPKEECELGYKGCKGESFHDHRDSLPQESWKDKIINIIAKLDNGSHSSNQLQGVDESITKIISQVETEAYQRGLVEGNKNIAATEYQISNNARQSVLTLLKSEVEKYMVKGYANYDLEAGNNQALARVLSLLSNHETKNNG